MNKSTSVFVLLILASYLKDCFNSKTKVLNSLEELQNQSGESRKDAAEKAPNLSHISE